MSTRATYQFKPNEGRRWEPTTTIYVHYDGYPEGAAVYFYETLMKPSKGSMATQFIRAVPHAELTHSHDAHGDTEYRCTVQGDGPDATLTGQTRHPSWDKWIGCYIGSLRGFIEKNHPKESWEGYSPFHPFKEVEREYGGKEWLNLITAGMALNNEYGPLHHLRVWDSSTHPGVGSRTSANWRSCRKRALLILEAFPELWTDESHALIDEPETSTV